MDTDVTAGFIEGHDFFPAAEKAKIGWSAAAQIARVDVNCFYASAERAFNPALEGRPVIVLFNK
jgi:hypothetical protein